MEKAKLTNIRRSKKGRIIGEIMFSNESKMQIPPGTNINESMNNRECEISRSNGIIETIRIDGEDVYMDPKKPSGRKGSPGGSRVEGIGNRNEKRQGFQSKTNHQQQMGEAANAPYNFIPLNESVVPGEEPPSFECYFNDNGVGKPKRYTGYIICQLETLTPLYIRDTYTKQEENRRLKEDIENPDFFSPLGSIRIPGSSLRGMIRNLVEIMGWGKFGFTDQDKRLFFRAVGDTSSLGRYYRSIMLDEDDNLFPKIQSGVLKKGRDNIYRIRPSATIKGTQIYRVNFDKVSREIADTNTVLDEFKTMRIFFKPVRPENQTHHRRDRRTGQRIPYNLKYALVKEISAKPQVGYVEGILVSSGNLGRNKHMHWIINIPKDSDPIILTEAEINLYRQDEERKSGIDLLKKAEQEDGVPCFYIITKTGEKAIGHTGMFRLPYRRTIKNHILPEEHRDENNLDIAESIFGKVSPNITFASRVFFEDAYLGKDQEDVYLSGKPLIPKILSGPKPTTFQHYLDQDPKGGSRNLNHWDTEGIRIRGNKLYWHRRADRNNWRFQGGAGEIERFKKQLTSIKPIRPHVLFNSKIRFENLTAVELGALLFALELPQDCCHKLGMGKPLGLGTVRIIPALYLTDRKSRYGKLFIDENWHLAEKQSTTQIFKDSFERYVLDKGAMSTKSLWDSQRMKELKEMLMVSHIHNSNWHRKTEYMELNEFRKRRILPKPTVVTGQSSKWR